MPPVGRHCRVKSPARAAANRRSSWRNPARGACGNCGSPPVCRDRRHRRWNRCNSHDFSTPAGPGRRSILSKTCHDSGEGAVVVAAAGSRCAHVEPENRSRAAPGREAGLPVRQRAAAGPKPRSPWRQPRRPRRCEANGRMFSCDEYTTGRAHAEGWNRSPKRAPSPSLRGKHEWRHAFHSLHLHRSLRHNSRASSMRSELGRQSYPAKNSNSGKPANSHGSKAVEVAAAGSEPRGESRIRPASDHLIAGLPGHPSCAVCLPRHPAAPVGRHWPVRRMVGRLSLVSLQRPPE